MKIKIRKRIRSKRKSKSKRRTPSAGVLVWHPRVEFLWPSFSRSNQASLETGRWQAGK
jgi:hypothetical protein